ncbi:MAG TPA: MarR family transcriptional regulator [Acidimicrobiales bacterium]|nr:MarR family transcriptional regulator [Acidimicrobiales bacterium]
MSSERREVAGRLHSAAVHLLRMARTVDGESGLSPSRLSALSVLVFGGPRTVGALAAAEGVRSPTITQLVNGLEADGLVRRLPASTGDGRRVVVEATPAGRRILRRAQARRLDVLAALLETSGEADLAVLDQASAVLDRLTRDHMGEATGAGPETAPTRTATTPPRSRSPAG